MAARNLAFRHRLAFSLLRAGIRLGGHLPAALLGRLGELLGLTALGLARRYRRDARCHLEIAFPTSSGRQHRCLLRAMARHLGRLLAEVAWLCRASHQELEATVTVAGLEHLREALRQGRGAVLVTGHCGNWELLNTRLAVAGMPLTVAVRAVDHRQADDTLDRCRRRFGTETVLRDRRAGRRLLRALYDNRVVGLLIDQDISHLQGVFVPFFGRPAWTPSGAAELVLRVGCPVIPAFISRQQDHTHHVEVLPPLPMPTVDSPEDRVRLLTAAATGTIERQVQLYPEQWVWFHKRWKTRPGRASAHDRCGSEASRATLSPARPTPGSAPAGERP